MSTIDVFDSFCSRIRLDVRGNDIMRVLPHLADDLNEDWITDKVRFSYDAIKRQRLLKIFVKTKLLQKSKDESLVHLSVEKTLRIFAEQFYEQLLKNKAVNLKLLLGKSLDLETLLSLKLFSSSWFNTEVVFEGLKNVPSADSRKNYLAPLLLENIENVDFLILNGINLRLDFPILNIKVKKRTTQNLIVFNIGNDFNSNFAKINLGSSFVSFYRLFLLGKHVLNKILINNKCLWLNGKCLFFSGRFRWIKQCLTGYYK